MIDFESNIPLVIDTFNKCFKSFSRYKDDLIQCGEIGLWKACSKFDESRKFAFSTFAEKCIRNEMLMFLRKERKFIEHELCCDDKIQTKNEFDEYEFIDKKIIIEKFVSNCKRPEVIELWLKGFKQREIAEKLGIDKTTVNSIIKREINHFKSEFIAYNK